MGRLHYNSRHLMVIEIIDIRCKRKSTNKNELHWNSGNLKIMKYLIEKDANIINHKDFRGRTALHYSFETGNLKYGYLIRKEIKLTHKNELN